MTDEIDDNVPASPRRKALLLGAVGVGLVAVVTVGTLTGPSTGANAQWSRDQQALSMPDAAQRSKPEVQRPPAVDEGNRIHGIVKAKEEATIASRITARIVAMPYGEGDAFSRGALLARFDCSQVQAQLHAAQAASAAYRTTYETNVELDQYNAIGKNEVSVAKANLGKAEAEAKAVAAQLSDCGVYAPFSGKVVEQIAHEREVAASGQPLLTIQSGGNLEIELIVPSRWLTALRPGAQFTFKIDETGESVQGTVKRLGASVDAVSKTIRITGDITQSAGLVLPGMSGSAVFPDVKKAIAAGGATGGKSS